MSFGGIVIEGIELVLEAPPKVARPVDLRDALRTRPQILESMTVESSLLRRGPAVTTRTTTSKPAAGNRTLFSDRTLLTGPRLSGALQQPANRDAINTALRELLSAQVQSKLPSGFGLHSRTNHQLGSLATARAEIVDRRITVTATVPRNRYFAQITTPGLLTSHTDPNFHLFYDLAVRATFLVPETAGGTLVHESAVVSATNVTRPSSRNLISQAVFVANDLFAFMVGPDFIARARADRHIKVGSLLSVDLAGINAALGGIASTLRLERSVKHTVLVLLATTRPAPPPPVVR